MVNEDLYVVTEMVLAVIAYTIGGSLITYLPMALVIGAVSVATASGAVIAIVNELKAHGPFTSTLLGVIAIDDALAIIFFALAGTAAHFMMDPSSVSGMQMMGSAVAEIVFSFLLGILAGAGLKFMAS